MPNIELNCYVGYAMSPFYCQVNVIILYVWYVYMYVRDYVYLCAVQPYRIIINI